MLHAMRQTAGSLICPNCRKLIGASEERCPFCGAWNPSFYGYGPALQRLVGQRMDFIQLITIGCVALYVASLVLQPEAIFQFHGLFGILSPGTRALYQLGMTGGFAWERHWWWTLLTAIYLHGGILHIFFNLMWVRNLAPAVDHHYGPARGFIIFSISGATGFLLSNLVSGSPTIGASGSIFGLLAALIVVARRTGHSQMSAQLWQWAIILFVFGVIPGSGVNNWAHAGGFAGGFLATLAMPLGDQRRESPAIQVLAIALIALTLTGFVLSFVKVTSILLMH